MPTAPKKVLLLGSTGSIGTSALKVAAALPDRMEVVGLAAHSSVDGVLAQVHATGVKQVAMADAAAAERLRPQLPSGQKRSR